MFENIKNLAVVWCFVCVTPVKCWIYWFQATAVAAKPLTRPIAPIAIGQLSGHNVLSTLTPGKLKYKQTTCQYLSSGYFEVFGQMQQPLDSLI